MELREILRRRRMHRHFSGEPVPRETIDRIARTIRRVPTGGFTQGVSVVVVTDPEQRARIVKAREEAIPKEYAGNVPWMADAAALFVICAEEERYHQRYRQPDKLVAGGGKEIEWPVPYWFVDAGAYMMLVLLAAIDEGLAAAFFGVAAVGVPAPDPNADRASSRFRELRRPDEEVIRWERWDDARG